MMAAVLIMAMTAGVLGGCGNSTGNNAKTDTNAPVSYTHLDVYKRQLRETKRKT